MDLGKIILIAVGVFFALAVLSKEWERYEKHQRSMPRDRHHSHA